MERVKAFIKSNFHLSKLERESLVAMGGMAAEYHNIFLYGYLVSVINPYFFKDSSYLITLSAILLSYIMGPLGAIICGHIGDTLGRKRILAWALAFVSISSFFISVLPSYDQIGIVASILFILLRSIQAVGFGGDAVGLVTFILEEAPARSRGWFGGLMSLGSAIGVFVASLEVSLLDPLQDISSQWKWRIPLCTGIIGTLLSIYFYRILGETTVFKHYTKKHHKKRWPLLELLKNYKLSFLRAIGVFALAPIITAVIFSFIPYLGETALHLSSKFSMWSNTIVLFVFSIFAPLFGALSDKIGRKPILFGVSLIFLILGFPLFSLLEYHNKTIYFCVQLFFSWVASAYYGIAMTINIEHLPTNLRYTGVALSFYLSYVLFGGINGQYIVKFLINGVSACVGPVFYLLLGSIVVFLSALLLKEEAKTSLEKE